MNTSFEKVESIFHELLEAKAPFREALIQRWRDEDPLSLEKALQLLKHSQTLDEFFESPPTLDDIERLKNGSVVDDFKILSPLGAGSFGAVYLAEQISLGRLVAVKVSADLGNEGRTMAPLEHENIVRIFSELKSEKLKRRLLCMQYIPGCSLEQFLAERSPLELSDPLEWCLRLGLAISNALAHAHSHGVLHLDVKPGNILIHENGTPYLSDFNISWTEKSSGARFIGGTAKYMSPEQERALQEATLAGMLSPRSDLYSLGVVLREVSRRLGCRHGELDAIITRLTQTDPKLRYESAELLAKALASCLERKAIIAALPERGVVRRAEARFPTVALFVLPILPQILGSTINITYNHIWIISKLSAEQVRFFERLVIYYNPVIYSLCLYLILRRSKGLFRYLKSGGRVSIPRVALRNDVREMPRTLLKVISLAWFTGALFFPTALYLFTSGVGASIFLHFFVSFALSCVVATTYSFLYTQMFLLRNVYPDLMQGVFEIRKTARQELRGLERTLSRFHYLAAVVPLFAAGIVLWIGPLPEGREQTLFRILLSLLLLSGALGSLISLRGLLELSATLGALCSSSEERTEASS